MFQIINSIEPKSPELPKQKIDLSTASYNDLNAENLGIFSCKRCFCEINYTDSAGIMPIRQNAAKYISQMIGVSINPRTVFLTNGADHAISVALAATSLKKPGNVYLPAPYYFKYPHQIGLFHKGKLITQTSKNEHLDAKEMLTAAEDATTSAVIFNNPNNPLGVIQPKSVLDHLLASSASNGTQIIYDIVYAQTVFNPIDSKDIRLTNNSPLSDRIWLVGGLSKSHGVPGWRLGFLVCPEDSIELTEHLTEIFSSNISTASQFVFNEVITCSSYENRRMSTVSNMATNYQRMAKYLQTNHPWLAPHLIEPKAGIFCCLDVRKLCSDDEELQKSLKTSGIDIKIGGAMGYPGLIRIPLSASEQAYSALFERVEALLFPKTRPMLAERYPQASTQHL